MTTTTDSKHSRCVPIGIVPACALLAFLAGAGRGAFSPAPVVSASRVGAGASSLRRDLELALCRLCRIRRCDDGRGGRLVRRAPDGEVAHPDGRAYSGCFQVAGEVAGRPARVGGTWDGPGSPVFVWSEDVQQDQQPSTTTSSQTNAEIEEEQ